MFSPSSALCFVQGAPLRLCGRFRSFELLSCSRRPLRPMPLPGANFQTSMLHTQDYHGINEIDPLTIDDYHVLIEAGRLDERRVELLNGSLIRMHPQSFQHRATAYFIFSAFYDALKDRATVFQAAPITLTSTNSEPEPDVLIASGVPTDYKYRHPVADDIILVVEVSNSTLRKDSYEKLELYALQNIHEYWIVDVARRSVRVLRNPQGKRYLHDESFCTGDIAPAAFPDVVVDVENLF